MKSFRNWLLGIGVSAALVAIYKSLPKEKKKVFKSTVSDHARKAFDKPLNQLGDMQLRELIRYIKDLITRPAALDKLDSSPGPKGLE